MKYYIKIKPEDLKPETEFEVELDIESLVPKIECECPDCIKYRIESEVMRPESSKECEHKVNMEISICTKCDTDIKIAPSKSSKEDEHKDTCSYCKGDKTVGNCSHSEVKPVNEEECDIYPSGEYDWCKTHSQRAEYCKEYEHVPNECCEVCSPTPKPSKHEPKNGGCDGCTADVLKNGMTVEHIKPNRLEEIREKVKNTDVDVRRGANQGAAQAVKDLKYLLPLIDKKNEVLDKIKNKAENWGKSGLTSIVKDAKEGLKN